MKTTKYKLHNICPNCGSWRFFLNERYDSICKYCSSKNEGYAEHCDLFDDLSYRLFEHLKYYAFVRFLELWGKFNSDLARRGLGCKRFASFGGMIGSQNCKKTMEKRADDCWYPINFEKLYPKVKRLPPEGVKRAKEVAREINHK